MILTTDVHGRPYLFVIDPVIDSAVRLRGASVPHHSPPTLHSVNASNDANDLALLERLSNARRELAAQIAKRIVGQAGIVDDLVAALLAGGHVVLIGVPGLA